MINIKRVIELNQTDASKVRARQKAGTMTTYFDEDAYVCFDPCELENWKSKKRGRQPRLNGGK